MPAAVAVAVEDVFAQVPETFLRPLLVTSAGDFRIEDFLDVELRHLERDGRDRHDSDDTPDEADCAVELVLDRRRQPALRAAAVVKTRLAVAQPAAPVAAVAGAVGQPLRHAGQQRQLAAGDLLRCRHDAEADLGVAAVDAEMKRLGVTWRSDQHSNQAGLGRRIVNGLYETISALPAFRKRRALRGLVGMIFLPWMLRTATVLSSMLFEPC
jgi:hypothetical protein